MPRPQGRPKKLEPVITVAPAIVKHSDYKNYVFDRDEQVVLDLFKKIFFIGTEPYAYDEIYRYPWLFPKLTQDLTNESGLLHKAISEGKQVYAFGQTQPGIVTNTTIGIQKPVIVFLIAEQPIDEYLKLGVTSV